jgi:hypothetical protein
MRKYEKELTEIWKQASDAGSEEENRRDAAQRMLVGTLKALVVVGRGLDEIRMSSD